MSIEIKYRIDEKLEVYDLYMIFIKKNLNFFNKNRKSEKHIGTYASYDDAVNKLKAIVNKLNKNAVIKSHNFNHLGKIILSDY